MDYMLGFWLEGAEVRPMLERRNGKPTITWGSSHAPLFGTIAVQLLMLVTQTAGLAQCSGCAYAHSANARAKLGPLMPVNTGASRISTDLDQYARPRRRLTPPPSSNST